jgi:hypothetical protein
MLLLRLPAAPLRPDLRATPPHSRSLFPASFAYDFEEQGSTVGNNFQQASSLAYAATVSCQAKKP